MDEQHQRPAYVQTEEGSSREKTREKSVPSVGQGSNEKRWGYLMGQKQVPLLTYIRANTTSAAYDY